MTRLKTLIIFLITLLTCLASAHSASAQTEAADTIGGKELGEVTVEFDYIEHKGSRDIVTITPALRKGAKNISEVIGRTSGFRYDQMTKTLKYLGSAKVKILVDSIDKDIDDVKQLGHQRFSKFDVIFNPVGRYQDYDVLVNLHTKINYVGYDLYAEERGTLMPSGRNGKGKDFSQWENKFMFNHVRDNLTLGAYASYFWDRKGTSSYSSTQYPLNNLIETSIEQPRTAPTDFNKTMSAYIRAFADYKINSNHTLSFTGRYMHRKTESRNSNEMSVTGPEHGSPYMEMSLNNSMNSPVYDYNAAIYYMGHTNRWYYNASVMYSDTKQRDFRNTWRSGGFDLQDNRIGRGYYELADVDVSHITADEKWVFNFNYRVLNNDYRYYRLESGEKLSKTNQLLNRGTVVVGWYPAQKLSIRLSGGVQANRLNSGNVSETHVTPRADLYLSYKFTRKNWMRIYYTTSVEQPFLGQVTDYGQFTDSLRYTIGNPYLKDAPMHNVNIVFSLWNTINIRAMGGIAPRQLGTIYRAAYGLRPDGMDGAYVLGTPENTSWKYWGFRAEFTHPFGEHWYLSGIFDIEKEYASFEDFKHQALVIEGDLMGVYSANDIGLSALMSYHVGNGGSVTAQSTTSAHTDRLSAMVRKSFLKDRLEVELTYNLPLHFTSGKSRTELRSPAMNLLTWSNNQFRQDNMLVLTVSYRLQKGQRVRKLTLKELEAN